MANKKDNFTKLEEEQDPTIEHYGLSPESFDDNDMPEGDDEVTTRQNYQARPLIPVAS